MRLSKEFHPYYPATWFNKEQAEALLSLNGLPPHLTLAFCNKNGIEVSSTGHIRRCSLDSYIWRVKDETQGEDLEAEWQSDYYRDIASGVCRPSYF